MNTIKKSLNKVSNINQKLYYCDDTNEINNFIVKENCKIYSINNNQLYQAIELGLQDSDVNLISGFLQQNWSGITIESVDKKSHIYGTSTAKIFTGRIFCTISPDDVDGNELIIGNLPTISGGKFYIYDRTDSKTIVDNVSTGTSFTPIKNHNLGIAFGINPNFQIDFILTPEIYKKNFKLYQITIKN